MVWFILFLVGFLMTSMSIFKSQLQCAPPVEIIKYINQESPYMGQYISLKELDKELEETKNVLV